MLRYTKSKDRDQRSSNGVGYDSLFSVLADVTFEMGRGREVVAATWLSDAVSSGDNAALTFLAGLHLGAHRNGEGLAEAMPLLLEAAEKGYTPAQTRLGFIYLAGLGEKANPAEAAHWLAKAAGQGQMEAQSLFGMMLAAGIGVEMNPPEAERLLALAAQQGDSFGTKCLEVIGTGLLPEVAAMSIGMLRVLASVGASLPDDAGDAELHRGIVALANEGDADACFVLSFQFFSNNEQAEALRWLQAAAEAGQALAALALGFLAFIGHDEEAARWLDKASRQGVALAQCLLGVMYKTGRGVAQDLPEASRLFEMARERMEASSSLAGLVGDPSKQPYLEDIFVLAGKMLVRNLVASGFAKLGTIDFLREALVLAEHGDPSAQFFSGITCLSGDGVEQDMMEAARWFQKAAEQGHAAAQFAAGRAFDKGEGVRQDRAEAVRWFKKAAEQENADAQFVLGLAFYNGEGVEMDIIESLRWLKKAAKQGFEPAKEALNRMAR